MEEEEENDSVEANEEASAEEEEFSGSEEEDEEEEEVRAENQTENATSYIAKDKTVWNKNPDTENRTGVRNILRQVSGPHRSTEMLSIAETFKKFFTPDMISLMIRYTNIKASQVFAVHNNLHPEKRHEWKPVTEQEMYAFVGLLLFAGVTSSNGDDLKDLWKPNSHPIYRATFGINRFWSILRFIRFDDCRTREARVKLDKVAPIRDLWIMLVENLYKMYRPTANLTIDEQLYPFRGRTPITQYIPNKPAKYGIKVWWICDAENGYPCFGEIYAGKQGSTREKNQGNRVVKTLAAKYKGSGRNIYMDNFFTSLPVAEHLLSWQLTITGTLKKNKPYIPQAMLPNKNRAVYSTIFGFKDKVSLCSYVPKKNKAVIMLSTTHSDTQINDDVKSKPVMITDYNRYKVGVDLMDQMLGKYSCQRKSRRWPLAFFFNMLNIAGLGSYIVYMENNAMIKKKNNQRKLFLKDLCEELCSPEIIRRSQCAQTMRHHWTKVACESVLGTQIKITVSAADDEQPKRDSTGRKVVVGSCYLCYQKTISHRRKTRKSCPACERPICQEHTRIEYMCTSCAE